MTTNHYERLSHTRTYIIEYWGNNRCIRLDQEHQSFIYHAYVYLSYTTQNAARAFRAKYPGLNRVTGPIVEAVVEYMDIHAMATSPSPSARHWKAYQIPYWTTVWGFSEDMERIVNQFGDPGPTSQSDGVYYVPDNHRSIHETIQLMDAPPPDLM